MKKFSQFITENYEYEKHSETERSTVHSYSPNRKHRLFYDSHLKDSHKNWIQKGRKIPTASATIDVNHDTKTAYINRIE